MRKQGFTLIELLVVIVIIGILVAIALPNFIRIKDKAKEAEVKQNCHAIQLGLERYAVDSEGSIYPVRIMGGDWTDSYVVWQSWVDMQDNLNPAEISNPTRAAEWVAAEQDAGDPLVMESYLPSYPGNPFIKNKTDTLLPRLYHTCSPLGFPPLERIVGGRESNKMAEVFGPTWIGSLGISSIAGDFYVHHIFNNPKYDLDDLYKEPPGGWTTPSGNMYLTGNFSYWPRTDFGSGFAITGAADPQGYTVAGYGSIRTAGQDVYNRNGNYKGRFRTEPCETDCRTGGDIGSGIWSQDIPCICNPSAYVASKDWNNGGSDTIVDGVVITLDSGLDKKSAKVNVDTTETE